MNILDQTLLLFPLVLGLSLSYGVLHLKDLTVEGSFTLGAALYAKALHLGSGHAFSFLLPFLGGGVVGICVALIQQGNRVNDLIAAILMLFILYSVNLQVMGAPNLSLLDYDLFEGEEEGGFKKLLFLFGSASVLGGALLLFLKTRAGLFLRAAGNNPTLFLGGIGRNPERYRMIALMISNALAAFSGALTAQMGGYADVNMGIGFALIGVAAVLIGQQITSPIKRHDLFSLRRMYLGAFVGAAAYFTTLHILLGLNINPINLRLGIGLFLILTLRSIHQISGNKNAIS